MTKTKAFGKDPMQTVAKERVGGEDSGRLKRAAAQIGESVDDPDKRVRTTIYLKRSNVLKAKGIAAERSRGSVSGLIENMIEALE